MANEVTIPEPLSGVEVKKAILFRVEEALSRDCYIRDVDAYATFRCKVRIELELHDSGRVIPTIEKTVETPAAVVPEGENPDEYLERTEAEFDLEPEPPNKVRKETDQPVPVRVQKGGKTVTEKIKYARKSLGPVGKKIAADQEAMNRK